MTGSSPRGRGKLEDGLSDCYGTGLIPARAGKTWSVFSSSLSAAAHPRAGGENGVADQQPDFEGGSSPRGWGKLEWGIGGGMVGGLIPARAGKTPWLSGRVRMRTAHPRAGGENLPPFP